MDRLIKATKDSDHKELQALSALASEVLDGDDDFTETESEEDEVYMHSHINFRTKHNCSEIYKIFCPVVHYVESYPLACKIQLDFWFKLLICLFIAGKI